MAQQNPVRWLAEVSMSLETAEIKDMYGQFMKFYTAKLWHQLTEAMLEFLKKHGDNPEVDLLGLYEKFISSFEGKLDQLKLARILVAVAERYGDPMEGVKFLEEAASKFKAKEAATSELHLTKDVPQARVLCKCEASLKRLRMGNTEDAKASIELSREFLDQTLGVESVVYSSHYRLQLEFYKVVGPPEDFYKNSLLYLAYTPLEFIPATFRQVLAFDLCLAALVAESIYSFGDLLMNEILGSVENTERGWVVKLLRAFNAGDISGYDELQATYKSELNGQQLLVQNAQLLSQKIAILALIEYIFHRPLSERSIPFSDVAKATRLPLQEVELLIMKALSTKLIRGSIDQVDQVVHVTWVQPRILDVNQIASLRDRLSTWSDKVNGTLLFLEGEVSALTAE